MSDIKNILGLDLGTNSIGWALVQQDFENKQGEILGMGSRIIPMDAAIMGDFDKGNSISQTAERTTYRGVRRLRERHLLRRERLHRVLHLLGFLPEHYDTQIDFDKRFGKFIPETEPKLAYSQNGFLFQSSFYEMLEDFKEYQPEFLKDKNGNDCLIPHDWTIYYLRKKALTQKIEKEELAWIILNFNQKRGYYQLRGEEEEENPNKLVEFHSLKVVDVVADETKNNKGETWYSMHLENGWIYRRSSKTELFDWKDKVKEFIVTTDLNDDGTEKLDKEGSVKRSFRAPSADDWTLLKKKSEKDISNSNKTVGTYIFDNLLLNPKQKIKGKLVRTIERKFYKDELLQILTKQKEFHSELQDENLLMDCVRELYRNNNQHQQLLSAKDFVHLFLNDIIFYQRPLRSQKSSISNCSLESRKSKDGGVVYPIKVVSKSNPYYQEFRLLQWIQNLVIYRKDDDVNVTNEFVSNQNDWEALLDFLNTKKEIDQKQLIEFLLKRKLDIKKVPKGETEKYRWNYVEDKTYPCNETRYLIQSRLDKTENVPANFLSFDKEMALWHIIYSVNDKIEYEKALKKFAKKNQLNVDSFFDNFKKFPPFKSDYGSFSEKAIKKLLPLMRFGKSWDWNEIHASSKDRIGKIITGEFDENIKNNIREKAEKYQLKSENDFQGLPLWLAQYIVYGRHSEASVSGKWNSVKDLEDFLNEFKQHSLRNPIVEQVITETLRVVKDIWTKYGNGVKDFFSEIHIELGREMKNTADERKRLTSFVTENENTNLRIKALLAEMALDSNVENVRPYSPVQQEILKIYEDGVLSSEAVIEEDILKISKTAQPSSSDLKRYKLWLEQRYKSPYTGQIIPLNKLFTHEYEIEHVIPQSRFFDDGFNNKVICEAEVNKLKDRQLGFEFIKNHHGQKVTIGNKTVQILEVADYEEFVKEHYAKNRAKRNKLLMEDIPEKMIERQLNDTRYISKYVSNLLSNIVRDDKDGSNDDGFNSKNLLPGNGKITTRLKQDWGLEAFWNELVLPRFERMNQLTNSTDFTAWNEKYQKFLPTVPLELSKGFSKKRIDHRHHAMDALVIACATRNHVNLLNNESAKSDLKRYDLQHKLRKQETYRDKDGKEKTTFKDFLKPWDNFTTDAKKALENIVVSFKQNTRVINKATNYYEKYVEKNGEKVKGIVKQEGTNWAIRKPLHKETVSGKVQLHRIKVAKGKILTATRKSLDSTFNEKTIESITDTGIQKILLNYLKAKGGNPEIAFSPEGIEEMNQNIALYNDGKQHQPILKVRVFEQGSKFSLGETCNKTDKYVEAAKGTNLFFGIYADKEGKRSYDTIPLNVVIERQKQGLTSVPELNEKGHRLLFSLSPNDLVYVPREDSEMSSKNSYKVVSFTGTQMFCVRQDVATSIVNKVEFSSLNKTERSIEGIMIKDVCIKLKVDRLGNISKA
ncbi:MAG TPA: HNH endonuclease domain-containing protein [Crocinitomicaceae bacterium]|nr:HNH endonuclease domain-containing protein [Crocinitomicaceae bacterium]